MFTQYIPQALVASGVAFLVIGFASYRDAQETLAGLREADDEDHDLTMETDDDGGTFETLGALMQNFLGIALMLFGVWFWWKTDWATTVALWPLWLGLMIAGVMFVVMRVSDVDLHEGLEEVPRSIYYATAMGFILSFMSGATSLVDYALTLF